MEEALILSHMGLVHSLAKRYRSSEDRADLVQAGTVGLLEAAKRYEPGKAAFATYARHWILYRMRQVIQGRHVVNPMSTRKGRMLTGRLSRVRARIEAEEGTVSPERLAEALGVSLQELEAHQAAVTSPSRSEDVLEALEDPSSALDEQIDAKRFYGQVKQRLDAYKARLSERDARILMECVLSSDPTSMVDMAKEYGVTKQRISQIIQKLRKDLATLRL